MSDPEKWHVSNAPALPVTMTVYGYAAHDFIAACDPQTILNLLDERDRLRALVDEAMHLTEHGERAPGGDETWRRWYDKVRATVERG
jgi:hypothetical protein